MNRHLLICVFSSEVDYIDIKITAFSHYENQRKNLKWWWLYSEEKGTQKDFTWICGLSKDSVNEIIEYIANIIPIKKTRFGFEDSYYYTNPSLKSQPNK